MPCPDQLAPLLRFVLLAVGLTYLLTRSAIFGPIRLLLGAQLHAFFSALLFCPACAGFWIGAVLGHWYWPFGPILWLTLLEAAIASCALGSFCGEFWSAELVSREMRQLGFVKDVVISNGPSEERQHGN